MPEVSPPLAELDRLALKAPPMTGLEYLSADALAGWWHDLDALARDEAERHPGGAHGYLREHNARWRAVGRVAFHLAENKRDPEYPFAFLATFANGLTAQGKVKHEPLSRALRQYAGAGNREAMLNLLLPVSKAAESSAWVRELVDSGEIYEPLAWSPRDAHEFLKAIPILESSGLTVRVPDWWNARKPPRARVSVKVDGKNSGGINVDEMLRFSVGMSLDGETLEPGEIAQLLESTGGLVPLRGKWVEVDPDKLKQALEHWEDVERDVRRDGISFFEGMRMLSGATLARDEDDDQATIREWSGLEAGPALDSVLERLRSPDIQQETAPPDLKAELRPYQATGYAWLRFVARLGLGACLADDMGLGKTVQVLALLLDLKRDGEKSPSLLVVPASLIANWKAEMAKFAPSLAFAVAHPSEGREVGPDQLESLDLVVTTYGMLARSEWIKNHRWRLAILDEAQAIKNSGTKQARAAKTLSASSRIAMTGTPVENRLSDLWSLFDFLNPGLLGTAKQFRRVRQAVAGRPRALVRAAPQPRETVHPSPLEDRQGGDRRPPGQDRGQRLLHAEQGPGGALPEGRGRPRRAPGIGRRDQPAGDRFGPVDAIEANLQPPRAGDRHERLRGRPEREVSAAGRDRRGDRVAAGEDARLHPVPRDRRAPGRVPRTRVRPRRPGAPRRHERPRSARRWWTASRGRTARRSSSCR